MINGIKKCYIIANKGKKADYTIPEGIKTGKLADNAENRAILKKTGN